MSTFAATGPSPDHEDPAVPVSTTVNGTARTLRVPAHRSLLEALRDQLGLTGSKTCCAEGECGACTVILDGQPVTSCLVLAVEVEDREVTTIEGLAEEAGGLNDLQEEFLAAGAVQCGFCIPGQVVAAECLLRANPRPTTAEVREGMSGNLCRCASYERIVCAVHATAERRAGA
jgi:carbon-monoxide dehydrogenase small subunit